MKAKYQIVVWLILTALLVATAATASFWSFDQMEKAAAARKHTFAVINKITPADISDPQEVIARAKAISACATRLWLPRNPADCYRLSRSRVRLGNVGSIQLARIAKYPHAAVASKKSL